MMDIDKIKQKILDLAIRGKLVPQDPNDEPASVLVEKIKAEKEKMVKEGKIKPSKDDSYIYKDSDNCYYEKKGNEVRDITSEIPFEIPNSWCWVRLSSISSKIQYGLNYPAKTKGVNKYLRITDIQNNNVIWDDVPFITIEEKEKDHLLQDNDIVFARTGATVGKSFLIKNVPNGATFASYLIRVKLINNEISEYIYYFFNSSFYWDQIIDKSIGNGQPNCNGTKLASLLIPMPSKDETNRIVKKVKEIVPIINAIKVEGDAIHIIANKIKFKILDYFFGEKSSYKSYYANYHIKDLCQLDKGKSEQKGVYPYLEAKVIRGIKKPKYIKSGCFIEKGTKVILVDGENSGEVMIVPFDGYLGSTFRILTTKDSISSEYLMWFVEYYKKTLKSNKTGSAVPHLNKNIFYNLTIALPPLKVQERYSREITKSFSLLKAILS